MPDSPALDALRDALRIAGAARTAHVETARLELAQRTSEVAELVRQGCDAGLTPTELAALGGVSRQSVHTWTRG